MENPIVSVIIPIFNRENELRITLDSVIHQEYKNLEIILVDDGSTDNSLHICKEYEKRDSRIKVLHQENKGVSGARNTGLKNSSGEYISFVDADDYLEYDCYSSLSSLFPLGYDVIEFPLYIKLDKGIFESEKTSLGGGVH